MSYKTVNCYRRGLESAEIIATRVDKLPPQFRTDREIHVHESFDKELQLTWKVENHETTKKPDVFGPSAWFTYHNSSAHLPETLSPVTSKRIAGFIDGIPEMTPCDKCSEHARSFIESNKYLIQNFKTRDEVFKFFVDFHNYVNNRLGKPIVSLEDARKMYISGRNVKVMKYTWV